jgi:chorismate-pyruvate lyase
VTAADLRRALDTAESVTSLLETLTGESIVADVVVQEPVEAERDNPLGIAAGDVVIRRVALLRGEISSLPYVCAESVIAPGRLPTQVSAQLEQRRGPIGRVLVTNALPIQREPLPTHRDRCPVPQMDGEVELARAYRLIIDGAPAIAIREWFLRPVVDALAQQTRR